MSTSGLYNPKVNERKSEFQKFLKRCKEEKLKEEKTARLNAEKERIAEEERLKEEEFTKKEEKVETARLKPVEEIKTDEQENEYCRIKKSDKKKLNKTRKQINKGDLEQICNEKKNCSFKEVQTTGGMMKRKCVPKAPQINVGPPEPPPQKISEEEIEEKSEEKDTFIAQLQKYKEDINKNPKEFIKWKKENEFDLLNLGETKDEIEQNLESVFSDENLKKNDIPKLRTIIEKLQQFKQYIQSNVTQPPPPQSNATPPTPKKNESDTDIIISDKGEKSEEYNKKELEKESFIKEIEKICKFIKENIKYHPGNKEEMLTKCNKQEIIEELKIIMKENHRDLDKNEIEYLEKEIEFLKEALKTFSNGRKLIIQNLLAELKKNNPNKKKITSPLLSQQLRKSITNPPLPTIQIEILKQEHDIKKEELQKKLLEDVKNDDKEKLEQAEQEYKNELKKLTDNHRLELENLQNIAKKREQELKQELKEAEDSKQDEETTKEEIKLLKDSIEKNNNVLQKIQQEKEEIQATRTENQRVLIEMRKKEKEEKRKQIEKFLKHKGESLKESIEGLKDEKENFTNMSEIKIDALESYPTLHDKIKKFLVFKENELIKAHHAKFYSDNIKRNNEKLVETLKLVPGEPFLGIEGLPLVSGFGSTPEQEVKKEEEIILKVVKEGVRKFIMSKAEHIFNPSQHEQLSVKEYLKNL